MLHTVPSNMSHWRSLLLHIAMSGLFAPSLGTTSRCRGMFHTNFTSLVSTHHLGCSSLYQGLVSSSSLLVILSVFNPSTAEWALKALIDFTLSNARRFYSSMGNALYGKGLRPCSTLDGACDHDVRCTAFARLLNSCTLCVVRFLSWRSRNSLSNVLLYFQLSLHYRL